MLVCVGVRVGVALEVADVVCDGVEVGLELKVGEIVGLTLKVGVDTSGTAVGTKSGLLGSCGLLRVGESSHKRKGRAEDASIGRPKTKIRMPQKIRFTPSSP